MTTPDTPKDRPEQAKPKRVRPTRASTQTISRERVRQIEQSALWKLKRELIVRGYDKKDLLD